MPQPSLPRWASFLAVGLFLLGGCERDEIRTYTVPKPPAETPRARIRLLAAIFEDGRDQWFFKLVGPLDEVANHAGDFMTFVKSVRFTGKADKLIDWTVPAGWRKGKGGGLRYATFYPAGKDRPLELTVFHFDKISPLIDNVERWCRTDLGRPAPRAAELAEFTSKFEAGDRVGIRVDMTGPGARKGKHPPMTAPSVRSPRSGPITFMTPEGWTRTGPRGGIVPVFESFRAGADGQTAEVTVIPLRGRTGELLGNVNRWREQVGLGPITQAQLDKEPPENIKVGDRSGQYFVFTGPAGRAPKRMLLVLLKNSEQTWYLKMVGPASVVGKNKSKFESFVQSVKFPGAADE